MIHYSVRIAAENFLFVDVHDEYRPSGMTRTYPNLFTQEGVAGAEQRLGADHTTLLPFTRFIIGAADYTLPFFWGNLPTTRGHQLGLAVIFFSPLNFVFWYDSPSQYPPTPDAAADFLASVPTTWDETHVLTGTPGESTAMARRKGERWYVGAITNATARTLPIELDFLAPGVTYTARTYVESSPSVFIISEEPVTQGDTIQAPMLANGGFALLLTPQP
jgi:alpha-glucosidase